ncbi:hypothetical protein HDV05_001981 [Chytridiales sp. JEL 0842]|nr:hypothetical protein HDV05_001981 [Chytridiales sp. JEL 0842]
MPPISTSRIHPQGTKLAEEYSNETNSSPPKGGLAGDLYNDSSITIEDRVMKRLGYLQHNPEAPFPTDDKLRLAEVSFDPVELARRYPIRWGSKKKEQIFKGRCSLAKPHVLYADRDPIQVVRLRARCLPAVLEAADHWPKVTFVPKVYNVDSSMNDLTRNEVTWCVNYAEQQLLDYYEDDFLNSNEIVAMEHPILGSLRQALADASQTGVFSKSGLGITSKPGFLLDRPEFYLPMDKGRNKLRFLELLPMPVDPAGNPAPFLIMNIPKVCEIMPKGIYQGQKYDVYGDQFKNAEPDLIRQIATPLQPGLRKSNLICMNAPHQWANHLRPKQGAYKLHEIRHVFRTAYTSFYGAMKRSPNNASVVIHTGDWGCGKFGGSRTVMCFLQIAAARAVGVERIYYHSNRDREKLDQALALLQKVWPSGKIEVEALLKALEAEKKEWCPLDKYWSPMA